MSSSEDSRSSPLALIKTIGDFIGEHYAEIGSVTGVIGGGMTVLDVFFGISLTPYGNAFVNLVTADGFIATMLFIVLLSQVLMFQRIEWLVTIREEDLKEEIESQKTMADGGDSNLPPRDDEGKFTTRESGGSNFLLLILAAAAGYSFGSQYGIDPFAGALVGIAIVSLLQSMDS